MRISLAAPLVAAALAIVVPAEAGPATNATGARLEEAQRLFFSGQYGEAAAIALAVRIADPDNLAASELRSSALHFQVRRALGAPDDKARAWAQCETCPELLDAFMQEVDLGRLKARARLTHNAADDEALFFLGKLPERDLAAAGHARPPHRME